MTAAAQPASSSGPRPESTRPHGRRGRRSSSWAWRGSATRRDRGPTVIAATACSRVTRGDVRDPTSPSGVASPPLAGRRRSHSDPRGARRGDGHARARSRCRDDPDRPSRRADGRRAGRNRRDPPSPRRGRRPAPPRRSASRWTAAVRRSAAWSRCASRSRLVRSARRRSRPRARCGPATSARATRQCWSSFAARSSRSARRWSSGTVSFEIDDGSGPLRISIPSSLRADRDSLGAGSWVEVRGVVGQETSGSKPNEGYRVWPRAAIGGAGHRAGRRWSGSAGGPEAGSGGAGSGGSYAGPTGSLDDLGTADLSRLRIGATIVVGPWKEMRVGGLLWDGARLVAVHPSSSPLVARLTRERRPPFALDLGGLQAAGSDAVIGVPMVRLGSAAGQTTPLDAAPAAPRAELAGDLPAWVSVVGQLSGPATRRVLVVDGAQVVLHDRCEDDDQRARDGTVAVTGVAIGDPLRLLVPCGGMRTAPNVAAGATRAALDGSPEAPASDDRDGRPGRGRRTCDDRSSPASSWRRRSPSWAARPSDGDAHRTPSRPTMRPSSRTRRRRQRTSRSCRCRARADRERERGVYSRAFIDRAYARREARPS